MNIRNIAVGQSLIPTIEQDFPDLLGWSKGVGWNSVKIFVFELRADGVPDLKESEFQRCGVCSKISLEELANTAFHQDGIHRGIKHHKSWAELKASATAGCHICKLFYFVKMESSKGRAVADGQQLYLLNLGTMELGTSFMDRNFFRLSVGKYFQEEIRINDESVSTRLVEDDPASTEAFARAQRWIDHCRTQHQYCVSNEDVPLPTRVLCIHGTSSAPGKVSLFVSNGARSKYTALSHCWGGISTTNGDIIRTCNAENFEELRNGICISRLPKTFQDAITVTRNLGIRYVWIDSLCIKQDSQEDWSLESTNMSEVYGNSFVTILASSADNSDQGFLNIRDPDRCLLTKFCPVPRHPEHWIYIRWPLSDKRYPGSHRKIRHRGWAFQEYSLPPRVLEYAPEEMEFHCNQMEYEEQMIILADYVTHDTYKELMWILSLPDIHNPSPNDEVLTHSQFAGGTDRMTIYERWYELVEGYSARDLTFETDKLPAIAGLARKIQHISGDDYMAGLWRRDLGAGLCWKARGIWKARGFGDLEKSSKYIAPSWSWASVQGSITHSIPKGQRLSADLIEYNVKLDKNNPLGELLSGFITLWAPIRKLKIIQGTVSVRRVERDSEIHDDTRRLVNDGKTTKAQLDHEYALRDQENVLNPRGTGICSVCFDFDPPEVEEVFLLQLLAEDFEPVPKRHDEEFSACGLVLERDGGEKENVFRRIGVYSVVDAEAPLVPLGSEHATLRGWNKTIVTIV